MRCVHALLDVARESDLVDAKLLTGQSVQLVLEAKLCRLILDSEVDGDHTGAVWQRSIRLDTSLRAHVNATVVLEE